MRLTACLLLAIGLASLLVVLAQAGFNTCGPGEPVSVQVQGGDVTRLCGGIDLVPFLAAGVIGVASGVGLLRATRA
ncbi:MAG: hypothetical protein ACR2G3_12585 [Solirubrobacterales bacterium]